MDDFWPDAVRRGARRTASVALRQHFSCPSWRNRAFPGATAADPARPTTPTGETFVTQPCPLPPVRLGTDDR